jgi:N-acetylmuramoyl-L-alanine amidase
MKENNVRINAMMEILPFNQRVNLPSYSHPGSLVRGASDPANPGDDVALPDDTTSLTDKKICIDPGHGGKDSGAVGPGGFSEKEANLEISKYLKTYLEGKGAKVVMTRDADVSLTPAVSGKDELQARVDIANKSEADIFISVHNNSSDSPASNGTETFYYSQGSEASKILSGKVFDKLVEKTLLRPRGSYPANFYVIKYTNMPAVLTESAFISNPAEEGKLKDPAFQKTVAEAIGEGVESYFTHAKTHGIDTEKPNVPDDGTWEPLPCEKYVTRAA